MTEETTLGELLRARFGAAFTLAIASHRQQPRAAKLAIQRTLRRAAMKNRVRADSLLSKEQLALARLVISRPPRA